MNSSFQTKKEITVISNQKSINSNSQNSNDEMPLEEKELNLETANNNVKQLLTGFLENLGEEDVEEYKNSLQNFKKKISDSQMIQDENIEKNKYEKGNKILRRKSKRKTSLYTKMPQKYNLNNRLLENLKPENSNINQMNNSFSNFSKDYSNEILLNKNKSSAFKTDNTQKKPKLSLKKIDFEGEEKLKTPKSTKSTKSGKIKYTKTKNSNFQKTTVNKKKSSLFNLLKKTGLTNNQLNEDLNDIEIEINKPKKNALIKASTINNEHIRAREKYSFSKISKSNFSVLNNTNNNLSNSIHDEKSEDEIDISNIRGLSKRGVQEINDIRIKLKDNMIGKNISENLKKKTKEFVIEKGSFVKNLISKKHKEKYRVLTRKKYVYDSLDDEEYDDEEGNIHIISPESRLIIFLDFLISICVLYDICYIPYYLAHDKNFCGFSYTNYHIIIDFIITIIYIIDLFANFFIGFYDFEEFLIDEFTLIALNYLSSYFLFDLLAAIPFKFYFLLTEYNCDKMTSNLYNIDIGEYPYILISFRILKVYKAYSKNKFVHKCSNFLSHYHHFSQWGSLYLDVFVFFMGLHFVASLFIFIGRNQYPNWISELDLENSTFIHIYIASIYYLIATITTVGYGDITPSNQEERIFGLILLIVGIIVYSFAVAGISNYIKEIDDKNADFDKKLKTLEDIRINYPKLSDDLYDRISRFLKYKHFNEKKDKNIIIDCLPLGLRNVLVYEMYKPIINSFFFFKNFDNNDFIIRIILAFKPILAMKNDILVKDGDFIEEIIFVKKGRLSLEIPIDLNSQNPIKWNMTNTTSNSVIDKKGSLSQKNLMNSTTNISQTKTFHLNDVSPSLSPRKRRTLEKKQKEKEELEEKEREQNIQYVKILEIRKNEHFGDILMFLNKRSPLCAKVKSKKAEFFFLNKTDAVEISTCYPRIWNKINKKSLFNMEQIKRLINKVVKIFFAARGIKNKEYIKLDRKFSTIMSVEESESNSSELKSIPSISDSNYLNKSQTERTEETRKKIGMTIKEEENDGESSSSSSKSSKFSKNTSVKSDRNFENPLYSRRSKGVKSLFRHNKNNNDENEADNNNNDNNKKDDNDNDSLNKSSNDISEISSELISNRTLKVENINKKLVDFSDCGSVNNSILSYEKNFFSTNSHSNNTPFRPEEINDEIYPNENMFSNLEYFKYKNLDKYNTKISNKSFISPPKIIVPESHSHLSQLTKNSINKNSEENNSENKNMGENIVIFDNISSSYNEEKINSKMDLEKICSNVKTVLKLKSLKEFIENSPFHKKNNDINNNLSIVSTEISFSIDSEYENINSLSDYTYSKNEDLRNKIKKILNEKKIVKSMITTKSNEIVENKSLINKMGPIILEKEQFNVPLSERRKFNEFENKINQKKSPPQKYNLKKENNIIIPERANMTPKLTRMRIFPKKSYASGLFNNNNNNNNKKTNLLNVISQNIELNQMNLNRPDEFYSEYFSKIINKNPEINNNKKSFISNTLKKNEVNQNRRKSAANLDSLFKSFNADGIKRRSSHNFS